MGIDEYPSRRGIIGAITLGVGALGLNNLAEYLESGREKKEFIKLDISQNTEIEATAYVRSLLPIDITNQSIATFFIDLKSKTIEIDNPIPAYSFEGRDVFFVVRKIDGVYKLVIKAMKDGEKTTERIFEINKPKKIRDWHDGNPKIKEPKPPIVA